MTRDDSRGGESLTDFEKAFFANRLNRRQLMGAGAAGLAAGLAGCSGDGGGDATATATETETETETEDDSMDDGGDATATATERSEQEWAEDTFSIASVHLPESSNWNVYSSQWPSSIAAYHYHSGNLWYLDGTNKLMMVEDWTYKPDEGTLTSTIRDDMTWHNGDPVTAEDAWVGEEIGRLQNPEQSQYKNIVLVDDYTIRWEWKEGEDTVAPSVQEVDIPGAPYGIYRGEFDSWRQKFADASNQKARDQINQDLSKFEITTQEFIDKGMGYGPWQMTDADAQRFMNEPFEEHPLRQSGEVKIPNLEMRPITEEGKRDLMIRNDELDGERNDVFPAQLKGAAPDYLQTTSRFGFVWDAKLNMNWTGPSGALTDRNVRRAVACVIDNENAVTNNNGVGFPIETQTGMDPQYSKNWLGEDFMDELIQYPVKQDIEEADRYLEKSDYSKKNGRVVDEDGEQVSLKFVSQNQSFRLFTAETCAQLLGEYGFDVSFQSMTWAKMGSIVLGDDGSMDYDMHVNSHYAGINYHPMDYYWPVHMFGDRLAFTWEGLRSYYDDGLEESPLNGKPLKPTYPSELGAEEVSGSGEQFHYHDLWQELKFQAKEERAVEILKTFARRWNYDLPDYDVLQREIGSWHDTKHWNLPEPYGPEESALKYKIYGNNRVMIRNGQIDPLPASAVDE